MIVLFEEVPKEESFLFNESVWIKLNDREGTKEGSFCSVCSFGEDIESLFVKIGKVEEDKIDKKIISMQKLLSILSSEGLIFDIIDEDTDDFTEVLYKCNVKRLSEKMPNISKLEKKIKEEFLSEIKTVETDSVDIFFDFTRHVALTLAKKHYKQMKEVC
tara:strand:- start:17422 stop:17901 length:480 start_codon:yes stop_codon:yes gene_type:complete